MNFELLASQFFSEHNDIWIENTFYPFSSDGFFRRIFFPDRRIVFKNIKTMDNFVKFTGKKWRATVDLNISPYVAFYSNSSKVMSSPFGSGIGFSLSFFAKNFYYSASLGKGSFFVGQLGLLTDKTAFWFIRMYKAGFQLQISGVSSVRFGTYERMSSGPIELIHSYTMGLIGSKKIVSELILSMNLNIMRLFGEQDDAVCFDQPLYLILNHPFCLTSGLVCADGNYFRFGPSSKSSILCEERNAKANPMMKVASIGLVFTKRNKNGLSYLFHFNYLYKKQTDVQYTMGKQNNLASGSINNDKDYHGLFVRLSGFSLRNENLTNSSKATWCLMENIVRNLIFIVSLVGNDTVFVPIGLRGEFNFGMFFTKFTNIYLTCGIIYGQPSGFITPYDGVPLIQAYDSQTHFRSIMLKVGCSSLTTLGNGEAAMFEIFLTLPVILQDINIKLKNGSNSVISFQKFPIRLGAELKFFV